MTVKDLKNSRLIRVDTMTTTNAILTSLLCYDLAERIEKDAQRLLMNDCLNDIKRRNQPTGWQHMKVWYVDHLRTAYDKDQREAPTSFTFQDALEFNDSFETARGAMMLEYDLPPDEMYKYHCMLTDYLNWKRN